MPMSIAWTSARPRQVVHGGAGQRGHGAGTTHDERAMRARQIVKPCDAADIFAAVGNVDRMDARTGTGLRDVMVAPLEGAGRVDYAPGTGIPKAPREMGVFA